MPIPESERSERYRRRMRNSGLRPIQIWVPDTSRPDFAARVRHQVDLLRGRAEEQEALKFAEAVLNEDTDD